MSQLSNRPDSSAMAEAVEAMRQRIEALNQRIGRQEKRVQRIQVSTSTAGRNKSEPGPAAETQATLADMVRQRDAMQAELDRLEAQRSDRAD